MKVLVIDDEPQMRRALKTGLERNDYQVSVASRGDEGLEMVAIEKPDVIILDLAMPGIDGFDVCKHVREWSSVPIIVLSVRASEQDKIKALDLGADDYLTKPFGINELLARMRAVLRRTNAEQDPEQTAFECAGLFIDFPRRFVSLDGKEVRLTPTEYGLLTYMVANADRVLTHRQLLTKVWGVAFEEDHHTLRVHMANLRNKIEREPERPRFIHTEIRVGYRFQTYETLHPRA